MSTSEHRFRWIGMAADGETILLNRYRGEFLAPDYATPEWFEKHPDSWRTGLVVDVETTGRNLQSDSVIEIGLRKFRFHRETGEILQRGDGYGALEDPGFPLSPEIVRITGITDEMLRGQAIDWAEVERYFAEASIVVAHNASFDRPFLDRYVPLSSSKVWGCSFKQIDWTQKGFPSQKLEILAIYHGFFSTAHRALADSDALLHLIQMSCPISNRAYFGELVLNARRKMATIFATHSPIETKNALKDRGYRWDVEKRVWNRLIYVEELENEKAWLTQNIYGGVFRGLVKEMALTDTFKLTPN